MTDYTSILPEGRQLQIDLSNPEEQMVLRIVEGGIVTVGFYYGTTVREHYNLDLVYDIAHRANADDLRAELAEGGEISALIDRVIAGHDSRWNGQRYQGTFSEDAQEAHDELRIRLESIPISEKPVWKAAEWLIGTSHPAAVPLDGATPESLMAEADRNGDLIIDGLPGMEAAVAEVKAAKDARAARVSAIRI